MISIFKKKSVLGKRLNGIEKELSDISNSIHTLERTVKRTDSSADAQEQQKKVHPSADREEESRITEPLANQYHGSDIVGQDPAARKKEAEKKESIMRDERFVSYLISRGFQTAGPLKSERNVQRNKAVIICIIVVMVFWWLLYKFM